MHFGFSLPGDCTTIQAKLATVPDALWEPAYDADGQLRPGAWVAEVTGKTDRHVEAAPTRTTSGEPSHPDAMLTTTRGENPDDDQARQITKDTS